MKQKIPDWLQKSRNKWQYNGSKRPPFAIEPKEGQQSVWDFPRPPRIISVEKEITVFSGDVLLASTPNALATQETASPPNYYIPPANIAMEHFIKMPGKSSLCEWKGSATYWALATNPAMAVGWSYEKPFPEFEAITGFLSFYPDKVDCFVGEEKARPQTSAFYGGWITDDLTGPFKGEPGTGHW